MVTNPTVSVAPTAHASLLHSIFAQLEKILNIATDPAVLALLPAKYQGYATAIAIVDQIAESVTTSAPTAPIAPPVAAAPVLQLVQNPVASVPVTPPTPGVSIPAVPVTPASPILTPIGPTIAQYLAGQPLRDAPQPPIGEGPGLPGEIPIYTYQPFFPGVDFNKLPMNTTVGEVYDAGAITMTEVESAFGTAGEPIDRTNPLFNTNLLAYGWPSVLNAPSH